LGGLTDPTTATTLEPVVSGTATPITVTTEVEVTPMPPVTVPASTTTVLPTLHRDTEVALWRCVVAFDDDFMPFTMRDNYERSDAAILACREAVIQLRVEPASELVSGLQTQVDSAMRAINLTRLDGRPNEEEAEGLKVTLDRFAVGVVSLMEGG